MVASKTKARLVILTTFALGIMTGALVTHLLSASPNKVSRNGLEEMTKEIKLNPQQREQIEKILAETQKKYTVIQKQVYPQFAEIRTATRVQIRSLLSSEQQTLYDEWNRKRDARFERRNKEKESKENSKLPQPSETSGEKKAPQPHSNN